MGRDIVLWFIIGICTAPIWGTLLCELWEGVIRPRLMPQEEVRRLADQCLRQHGLRAEEIAFIEEDRAWRYGESFEQGKWRRVRRELRRRREPSEVSQSARCDDESGKP